MKVLLVEDDPVTRRGLEELLSTFELEVKGVGTLVEARAAVAAFVPDALLTDLKLPDGDGIELIRQTRAAGFDREIVVLTGHGSVDTAVEAMKAGAFDYLLKPLRPAQLEAVLARLRPGTGDADTEALLARLEETGSFGTIVGRSAATREMCRVVARLARSDAPVMLTGESGSGKEAAARMIHALSRRREKPLVAVNCGAVTATLVESELFGHEKGAFTGAEKRRIGYFELAQGGLLFLDEVTEMSLELQVKFLRVLETRTFRRVGGNEELESDFRVVSSSNRDLNEAIREKRFREDLYYRLNVLPLSIAPLRERKEDVPLLARRFLEQVAEQEKAGRREFTPAALARLESHAWPGNVRELRNVVHRAYVLSDGAVIDERSVASVLSPGSSGSFPAAGAPVPGPVSALPDPAREEAGLKPPAMEVGARASELSDGAEPVRDDPLLVRVRVGDSLEGVEKELLMRTLEAFGGNKKKAAEKLGISLKTIYNKMKKYGL
jgi:DNA-binding NtrC family response regulator